MKNKTQLQADSLVVASGRETSSNTPLNVPMVAASNFILGGDYGYSRNDSTPTWQALEDILGELEDAHCISYASGMAAISAIFSLLKLGTTIVLPDDCYQGVVGLAEQGQERGFWQVKRIAVEDTKAWIAACETADLIWLESPSNPLLKVAEVDLICRAQRKQGALVVVDNTLATPFNQKPLDYGADIAIQSATKFIGGHSDLLSGIATTKDLKLAEALRNNRAVHGATPGVLESFLATRGCRTMAIRLEKAQASANAVAHWLDQQDWVSKVRYPGLTSHPTHVVAQRVLTNFGALISFDITGTAESTDLFCSSVRLIRHATSLGGVESTMERRAAVPGQTHLPPTMLRLCIGIENENDIIADLQQAFEQHNSK